jgi:hypothetical protein
MEAGSTFIIKEEEEEKEEEEKKLRPLDKANIHPKRAQTSMLFHWFLKHIQKAE